MRILLAAVLVAALFAGCLSGSSHHDGPTTTSSPPASDFTLPAKVTGMTEIAQPDTNATEGEWVENDTVYLSGPSGLRIYDIHDPANPVLLAKEIPDTGSRDVDLIHHPNGHLYAILADDAEQHMKLVDVTNPREPQFLLNTTNCDHTVAVVPGTTIVYGSWSLCQATHTNQMEQGDVEILDFADPLHPKSKIMAFPPAAITVDGTPHAITATSCHEMTFNADLHRAYCAAITDTQVWDDSDAWNPKILQVIDDPEVNIHHSVWDADNGTTLIIGDEFTGVLAPTPMCSDKVEYPTSALAFYDIKDLAHPKRVGYYNIPYDAVGASLEKGSPQYCSTHLGDVIDGTDLIVMGWYSAGTVLVDFHDPANPTTVTKWRADNTDTSIWETRYYKGHVYAADEHLGLWVLKVVGEGPQA